MVPMSLGSSTVLFITSTMTQLGRMSNEYKSVVPTMKGTGES
eukprot:CAMPEP_0177677918 /NCGR_PEP_ID=MMETSP0447-20121125/28699_1 /TAXON_ID=0 /ORGANISM="Stygamoeba regulata, Strain BSH-02190019" /LENGTH=41 /DNA_ID= /DNA_START= /DNA_END= /DNA_ORIENTATION=